MSSELEDGLVDPLRVIDGGERNRALRQLAGHLRRGELVLLLGAGVSQGLDLPAWRTLVERCEGALGLEVSERDLMHRIDDVHERYRDKHGTERRDFLNFVRERLYPEQFVLRGSYPRSILQKEMLIALGALVMSSVRGSVTDVLTLNFDDVLDWYLRLHGFRTQVVRDLPIMMRGDVDVHIHHIHGFLPLMAVWEPSDWLLLSYDQLVERLSEDSGAAWPTLIGSLFQSKVILAVGTSMADVDVHMMLRRAQRKETRPVSRGFVVDSRMSDEDRRKCHRFGLVPISVETYEDVPRFLLGICQEAAHLQ